VACSSIVPVVDAGVMERVAFDMARCYAFWLLPAQLALYVVGRFEPANKWASLLLGYSDYRAKDHDVTPYSVGFSFVVALLSGASVLSALCVALCPVRVVAKIYLRSRGAGLNLYWVRDRRWCSSLRLTCGLRAPVGTQSMLKKPNLLIGVCARSALALDAHQFLWKSERTDTWSAHLTRLSAFCILSHHLFRILCFSRSMIWRPHIDIPPWGVRHWPFSSDDQVAAARAHDHIAAMARRATMQDAVALKQEKRKYV
jgi:hypothetical protein